MARKDDILGIYAKEVERHQGGRLIQRRGAVCISAGRKGKNGKTEENSFACVPTTIWDWATARA